MIYQIGQEVWVRGVVENSSPWPDVRVDDDFDDGYVLKASGPKHIRTDADFTNPLDQAIVRAALEYGSRIMRVCTDLEALEASRVVVDAVQAKLDAERKPQTAEEIVERSLQTHRIGGGDTLSATTRNHAQIAVEALRSANLLKDDPS